MSVSEEQLDAYILIDHVDPGRRIRDVLREMFDQNPDTVRFTAQVTGPFIGFAAVLVPGLEEAHDLANGAFWDAGVRCETLIVVRPSGLRIPKRGSPDLCALVRARSEDPDAALDALDDRFGPRQEEQMELPYEERTFNYGAAIVTGRYDLLIDVGTPTFAQTRDLVKNEVRTVAGIDRTVTMFAHLPGNARRREL
jgi:hypothetical protein